MKSGIELITEERERQISAEGWTPEHDDEHIHEELVAAAICYLLGNLYGNTKQNVPSLWPWDEKYWKPEGKTFSIKNLQKAGALIAAEIDRIQRLNK